MKPLAFLPISKYIPGQVLILLEQMLRSQIFFVFHLFMICWDENLLGGKEGQRKFPLVVQHDLLFWYTNKMTQLKPAYITKLP